MRNLLYSPSVRYSLLNNRFFDEQEALSPFREQEEHYLAYFQLPGLKKGHVSVAIQEDMLKVSAKSPEDALVHIDYEKSFTLPEDVNVDELTAKLEDGILTVSVPKKAEVEPTERVIEISS